MNENEKKEKPLYHLQWHRREAFASSLFVIYKY